MNGLHDSRLLHPAVLWAGALVVLALRRLQAVVDAEFVFEDGREFYMAAWHGGLRSINDTYAGTLHVITRLIAVLEVALPREYAPLVGTLVSLGIVAGIAVYIAGDALSNVIPDPRIRLALAAVFVLLPNTEMTLGSPTFLQFYLGVFLVAGAVANRAGPLTLTALGLASATGPFSVLLLPLYVARAWLRRDRDSALRLAAVGIPAMLQLALLLTSGRDTYVPPPTVDPQAILLILGGHLLTQLIGGLYVVQAVALGPPLWLAAAVAVVLAALVVVAARSLRREELLVLGYAAGVVIAASLFLGTAERDHFIDPLSAARYFLIPGAMLATLIVLAASRRSRAGIVLAVILIVGLVGDFRLNARGQHDWQNESACIGGPTPCAVPVYPDGTWYIQWVPPAPPEP